MPGGRPIGGKPPVTAPTTATPCAEASTAVEMMIDRTTATTAPGTLGRNRSNPMMISTVPSANANVARLVSGMDWTIAHCCWNQLPDPLGTPSMSGIWPVNTWMPTPVRNPMSTEALRKSPMNPSLSTRATSSMAPHTSATRLVQATHSAVFGLSPEMPSPASPAARIAAVAESAPTTSSRDDPINANMIVGKITVYRPVTSGVCAIEV